MKEKRKFKILVVFFAIIILLVTTMSTTSVIARNKKIMNKYIALGDSIAVANVSAESVSYASLINDFFMSLNNNLEYENLSQLNASSKELLNIINNNKEKITEADLITISIGLNNILNPILNRLLIKFNVTTLEEKNYEEIESALLKLIYEEELQSEIQESLESFKKDFKEIKTVINELAPDSEVYINTVYNPITKEGELYDYFEEKINDLNKIIKNKSNNFKVIDSYELLNNQNSEEYTLERGSMKIYPSQAGHAILASQVINDYGDYVRLNIDKITNSSEYISGKTVPLTNIIILSENGVIGTAKTNIDGEFKLKTVPLKSGTNIEVFVYDKSLFSILYKFEKLEVRKALFTS